MALLVACLLPASLAAQTTGTDGLPIEALRFDGVESFDRDRVRGAIETRPSSCTLPALLPPCWLGFFRDTRTADPAALDADALRLRLFYYQRGYRDAQVDVQTRRIGDGVEVTFRVDEGRPVRVGDVEVADTAGLVLTDGLLSPRIAPGDRFDTQVYRSARDSLRDQLRNQGYPRAEVLASYFIPVDSPYHAAVSYRVISGPRTRFGAVEVHGADRVSPAIVRRMLTFEPGDLYRHDELLRSQRNLYELGIFRHIEVTPRFEDGPDTLATVETRVTEGNVHRVRIGAGVSTTDAVNAEGRWTSRNFLGGARRFELRSQIANVFAQTLDRFPGFETGSGPYGELNGALSADFSQPWLFGPYNTLNLGLFAERRSVPDVYIRTAAGGYGSLTRTLAPRTSVTLGYRPELTTLDAEDVFFCVSYSACAAQEIQTLELPHRLAPIVFSFTRDRSNALFSPTDGYTVQLDAEYAIPEFGSDFAYARLLAELKGYHEIADGFVLAGRLRPGWARAFGGSSAETTGRIHPQKRFFAGGPNSVRGFAQYRLGPKVLTVDGAEVLARPLDDREGWEGCDPREINGGWCDATELARVAPERFNVRPVGGTALLEGSIELRYPLWTSKLRGAAFVDFGRIWGDAEAVDARRLVWTPGFGFRYFSPVGPIRIDVGYNPRPGRPIPVVTTEVCAVRGDECGPTAGELGSDVEIANTNQLQPLQTPVPWRPGGDSFFNQLQVHFSIGQAF